MQGLPHMCIASLSLSRASPHPYTNILSDCLSIIFSNHIQHISRKDTNFSRPDLVFCRGFIYCWEFASDVDVRDFLKKTRGRKLTLQYVKARANPSVNDECFKFFRGIRELDVAGAKGSSSPGPFTDAAFENLRGIYRLNFSYIPNITSNAIVNLRGIKHLKMKKCSGVNGSAFENLRGIETLDIFHFSYIRREDFIHLRGIKELRMGDCWSGWIGWVDVSLENLRGIRKLDLSLNSQVEDGEFVNLVGIESLNISECETLTDNCVKYLRGVKEINLCHTQISNFEAFRETEKMTMQALQFDEASAPNLRRVRDLTVLGQMITCEPSLFANLCYVERLKFDDIYFGLDLTFQIFRHMPKLRHLSINTVHHAHNSQLGVDVNSPYLEDVAEAVSDLAHVECLEVPMKDPVWQKVYQEWEALRNRQLLEKGGNNTEIDARLKSK